MPDRPADDEAYQELAAYTLSHDDPSFLHQHVIDAHGAQCAAAGDPPIQLAFALIGLYLQLERGFTGREVQRVHTRLSGRTRTWPTFPFPEHRGAMTVADVVAAPAGPARDRAIDDWCRSVWSAYAATRPAVEKLLREHGII
jgi:hypothetical protein